MTKDETIKRIEEAPNAHYTKANVLHLLSHIHTPKTFLPSHVKKGDIFVYDFGGKPRPCVVIISKKEFSYAIPLSTTPDCISTMEISSRFIGNNYTSGCIFKVKNDRILKTFTGVFDNEKGLRKVIRAIKENMNELL